MELLAVGSDDARMELVHVPAEVFPGDHAALAGLTLAETVRLSQALQWYLPQDPHARPGRARCHSNRA
jgi:hypothetical protein